jgi:PIN domain nuclease of toxin-antitoxin system
MSFDELKENVVNNGFEILPIAIEHTSRLSTLNHGHKDSFDRMIIAQAITEHLTIIGKDGNFSHYNVKMVW